MAGRERSEGLYQWKPGEIDVAKAHPSALSRAITVAGLGLMTTGQSGAFRILGDRTRGMAAQTWNAAMSALGIAQHMDTGNSNTGKVYSLPKNYATDYELRQAR